MKETRATIEILKTPEIPADIDWNNKLDTLRTNLIPAAEDIKIKPEDIDHTLRDVSCYNYNIQYLFKRSMHVYMDGGHQLISQTIFYIIK